MTAERTDGRTGGRGWACSGRNELQGGGGVVTLRCSIPTGLESNSTRQVTKYARIKPQILTRESTIILTLVTARSLPVQRVHADED